MCVVRWRHVKVMDAFVVRSNTPSCHAKSDDAIFQSALRSTDEVNAGTAEQAELDAMGKGLQVLFESGEFELMKEQTPTFNAKKEKLQQMKNVFSCVSKAREIARGALAHAKSVTNYGDMAEWSIIMKQLDARLKTHDAEAAMLRRSKKRARSEDHGGELGSSEATGSSSASSSSATDAAAADHGELVVVVDDGANAPDDNIHESMRARAPPKSRKTQQNRAWASQSPMSAAAWKIKLGKPWTCKYPPGTGGTQYSGKNMHGNYYELVTSKPFCGACNTEMNQSNMSLHTCSPTHQNNVKAKQERGVKQQRMDAAILKFQKDCTGFGASVSELEHQFRFDLVLLFCGSNSSAASIDGDFGWFTKKWTKQAGLGRTHLADYGPWCSNTSWRSMLGWLPTATRSTARPTTLRPTSATPRAS